jgi:hypothetical protein
VDKLAFILEDTRPELQSKLSRLGISDYNVDYALVIHSYSLEDPAVYKAINAEMHSGERRTSAGTRLCTCAPYIKFVNAALESLPERFIFSGTCSRGVKWVFPSPDDHDPAGYFFAGKRFYFYEFKSSSQKMELMYDEQFCGKTGPRTIFTIHACRGFDISEFSAFGEQEKEVLFAPLSQFEVIAATKLCDPKCNSDAAGGFPDSIVIRQIAAAGAGAGAGMPVSAGAGAAGAGGGNANTKAVWSDSNTCCRQCDVPFSMVCRKHHCRTCGGGAVCAKCSSFSDCNGERQCRICNQVPAGIPAHEVCSKVTLYHGTSLDNALKIQDEGFNLQLCGTTHRMSSGAGLADNGCPPYSRLGRGIYAAKSEAVARGYAEGGQSYGIYCNTRETPCGGCVLVLVVDPGRVYVTTERDDEWLAHGYEPSHGLKSGAGLALTWAAHGYDSAYEGEIGDSDGRMGVMGRMVMDTGSSTTYAKYHSNQYCIGDPGRIRVVGFRRTDEATRAGWRVVGGRLCRP